jgi:hypothetical protein
VVLLKTNVFPQKKRKKMLKAADKISAPVVMAQGIVIKIICSS